ncbi:MAG TPA: hypothetical protein VLA68_03695 [Nitrososphaera sp.]|nr:hypothetical protein [Nitrososphaera sp.]
MEWELVDFYDDINEDPSNDRWLLEYNVPAEVASNGLYSVSYPKNIANSWAATYDYDITSDDDIDEMFDHIMYSPMMQEIGRLEKRKLSPSAGPLSMRAGVARRKEREEIAVIKSNGNVIRDGMVSNSRLGFMLASARIESIGIWEFVRSDMQSRIKQDDVKEFSADISKSRRIAEEKMIDMANRMNSFGSDVLERISRA